MTVMSTSPLLTQLFWKKDFNQNTQLEGTIKSHQVQLPDLIRASQKWKHMNTETLSKCLLNSDRDRPPITSLGSLFNHHHGKEMFPNAQPYPSICGNSVPFTSCHQFPGAEPSTFICLPPWGAAGRSEIISWPLLDWIAQLPSSSPHRIYLHDFQPCYQLFCSPLDTKI